MMGTTNCVYETPCGWCSKWDKECDKKIYTDKYANEIVTNKICQSESDHEWECCGVSTIGTDYVCKKCGTHKVYPFQRCDCDISTTI